MGIEDSGPPASDIAASTTVTETSLRVSASDGARVAAIKTAQDGKALLRRSYYVYTMSAASFGLVLCVLFVNPEPSIGKVIVEASFSLLEIVAVAYLGANVIDRSRLVDRFVRSPPPPPPLMYDERPSQSPSPFG